MKNNNTKITLALFAAIVAVIIMVPVVFGYLTCPTEKKFLGISGLYPVEQFYYLSVGPTQAVKGQLLFADKYGRLDENVLLNPIANIIGWISSLTNTSLPVAFNIFRVFASILLLFSFYYLSKQFIASRFTLFVSLLIYCFVSGFDFWSDFFHLSFINAVDDSFSEANMFIAMSGEYYLPMANALFILVLASGYGLFCKGQNKLLLCGVSLFLLGAIYVYGIVPAVTIISVAALYNGYSQKKIRQAVINLLKLSLFCLPIATYYIWLIVFQFPDIDDEGWRAFPDFFSLVSTFSFGLLFTIIGLLTKNKSEILKERYLLMWLTVSLCLIYIPQTILPIQTQMLIGLGAPLSIMFATTLGKLGQLISARVHIKKVAFTLTAGVIFCIVFLSSMTNVKFYVNQFNALQKQEIPCYLNSEIYNAMEWSSENLHEKNLVIISRKLGFIFSSITACKVYMGTAPLRQETPERKKTELAINLLRENKLYEAKHVFLETGADYLFFDKLMGGVDFEKLRETLKVNYRESFSSREVSIFQLK